MPLPFELNGEVLLPDPINFQAWLDKHEEQINVNSAAPVFGMNNQMGTDIYGPGQHVIGLESGEHWIYQLVRTFKSWYI